MTAATPDRRVQLRLRTSDVSLIDAAAKVAGKNRTSFMLEASRQAAEEILSDRALFALNETQWQAFHDALDRAPESNPGLSRLLATKAPWE